VTSALFDELDIFLSSEPRLCEDACTAQITSLFDMLASNALAYASIAQEIEYLRHDIAVRESQNPDSNLLADELRLAAIKAMERIDASCASLNLPKTRIKITYILSMYSHDPCFTTYAGAQKDIDYLRLELMQELQAIQFLRMDASRVKFYVGDDRKAAPFSLAVLNAFPSAAMDMREASNTLALERWYASVFHLMRVLEFGLRAMADKFGVPYEKATWHRVIEEVEAQVRKIDEANFGPTWKLQQKNYSEAAMQFMFFKDAWRNHIMHIRDAYDAGRATSIWQHVNEFMKKLVEIGLAEVPPSF
jgi:hypothetical protein